MSETVKLIIEIPADVYRTVHKHKSCILTTKQDDQEILIGVRKGILLDDVKDKILDYNVRQHVSGSESFLRGYAVGMDKSAEILDNIGKGE